MKYAKEKVLKVCDFLADFSIVSILFVLPVFFSFIYETWNIFELPKVVAFRYLLAIGVLSWVAGVFIRGEFKHRLSKLFLVVFSLLLIGWVASTCLSIHPLISLWGKYQRLQGLSSFFSYFVFFLLCVVHLDSWRKIKMCLWSIVAASSLVCLYGACQFLYMDPMNWAESFQDYRRIFSTLGQPNFLGHYLIMVMPVTVYCCVFLSKKPLPRTLLVLLLVLQVICLYYTWSRSAWLALVAEIWLAALLLVAFKKYRRIFWSLLSISALVAVLLGVLFFMPKNDQNGFWMKNRWISSFDLSVGSQRMRLLYDAGAAKEYWRAPWERKVFGYGQDVLADVTVKWYEKEWADYEKVNTWPDRIHNFFFDSLLSFGAFGVLASFAVFAYFMGLGVSFLRKSEKDNRYWLAVFLAVVVAGYFTNNLFSFSMTPQYVYFFFFLALLLVLMSDRRPSVVVVRLSNASKVALFVALTFFFGVFVFYKGAMAMKADYYFAASRDWSNGNNCQALEFNRLASIFHPEEDFYREEYIFNALNCFEAIKDADQKKTLKENVDIMLEGIPAKEKMYFVKLEEANVLSVYSANIDPMYADGADESFKSLLAEYPKISQVYLYYGYHKLRQKEYDAVVDLVDRAENLMPKLTLPLYFLNSVHRQTLASELVRFYELAAVACELDKDYDSAITYYTKVIKADPYRLLAYKRLADVYYVKGDIDSALRYNQRGYSLNRHDPSWPLALALLWEKKGDEAMALDYAQRVLSLDGGNEEAAKVVSRCKK